MHAYTLSDSVTGNTLQPRHLILYIAFFLISRAKLLALSLL